MSCFVGELLGFTKRISEYVRCERKGGLDCQFVSLFEMVGVVFMNNE